MSKSRPRMLTIALGLVMLLTAPVFAASKMPNFSLPDVITGKTVNSNSFEGKVLLVTFFATWCPPCIEEIPTLKKIHKSYRDQGFSVIGLSVDQGGTKAVSKLAKKKSINYPVLLADSETMQNFGGVYGIPVSFLVSKKGNVVKKYTGYIPESVFEKDLKKLL